MVKYTFVVNHSSNSVCKLGSENCSKKFLLQKATFLFLTRQRISRLKSILKKPVCPPFLTAQTKNKNISLFILTQISSCFKKNRFVDSQKTELGTKKDESERLLCWML